MGRPSHSPIWPFLLVVTFLFLLSVLAPREWEQIARRDPARKLPTHQAAASPRIDGRLPIAQPAPIDRRGDAIEAPSRAPLVELPHEEAIAPDVAGAIGEPAAPSEPTLTPEAAATPPQVATQPDAPEPSASIVENVLRSGPGSDTLTVRDWSPRATESETADAIARDDDETAASAAAESQAVDAEGKIVGDAPAPSAAVTTDEGWPEPVDLLRRLDGLACECGCAEWAELVEALVVELTHGTKPADPRARAILAELRALSVAVDGLAPSMEDRLEVIELLRARHALVRRLDVWELVPALAAQPQSTNPAKADVDRLATALESLDALVRHGGEEGTRWRAYLALDALGELAKPTSANPAQDPRRLAREVLDRLGRGDLTTWQRQFISEGPVSQLAAALRPWAREPFDPARLLVDVERFESTLQPSDARKLADDYQQSTWLPVAASELSVRLESNYRNANLRLTLSERLLKRLLPERSTTTDAVHDQVLGAPTRGTSTTSTQVDLKLVPSENKLRLALEATGQIFANTRSTSGPATLYTHSDSAYHARKLVDLDLHGIRTWPAESDCTQAASRLRAVSTDFDGVPLVGALVESVARSRHADKEAAVRSVLRHKVEAQARQRMDAVAQARIDEANRQLQERLLVPLERLALEPRVISAETTEERLTMRVRLAGDEQLAGHTPRPRAPGDSLASVQVHQSAFNNGCEQLKLEGHTYRLPELRKHVVETLNLKDSRFMDDVDEEVAITFADADAIRVRCDEGRIELSMAVAQLSNAEHTWKNFVVRVYYRPEVEGLSARLVRDGVVQLVDHRLSTRSQIAVRGVFSKAFSKERQLELVDPKWTSDKRTEGLYISQFAIQDGWVAAAVSEPRNNVAGHPARIR
ncbi:MAG: hypothetical protein HYX69_00265 [Planctomycetia bacterium]|nr:hypothetical protein [Planctomycetia bacterium]